MKAKWFFLVLLITSISLSAPAPASCDQRLDDIQSRIKELEKRETQYTSAINHWKDIQSKLQTGNYLIIPLMLVEGNMVGELPVLRDDFDHVHIASVYEQYGASAVSVLTDQKFFGGNTHYLADIKKAVHLPLLRKDFIIDPYQIYETRSLDGDALLLIAGILEREQLRDYIRLTESLGLFALVEVHCKEDLDKALVSGAHIIGINNRNLTTFSTDLNTSINLMPHIPADKIIISESGIHMRSDIETLMKAGIHAFLIGETLMRSKNIGKKLSELLGKE